MDYRREIDGLRTVAVLPVIFFHAGLNYFAGGFVGVDVFFVISGYLISSIIFDELEAKKFSVVNFYERRARRILPALFLVMFCCLPFAWFWLLPHHLRDFSESLIFVPLFSSNVLFWQESGYFGAAGELKPLLHTWSLAVEEQYYLFFPILAMLLWRCNKFFLVTVLIIGTGLSFTLAQWGSAYKPTAAFFLLPTRVWELFVGVFCALYLRSALTKLSHAGLKEVLCTAGLLMIVCSILFFDEHTPFPSFYTLLPTLGTALIIVFCDQKVIVGRFLGNGFFVGIGLISYSAYLWHQPIFAFARHRSLDEISSIVMLLLSALSILLAYVSWKYIEAPFRKKSVYSRAAIFKMSAAIGSIFVLLGLIGHFSNGFQDRYGDGVAEVVSVMEPSLWEDADPCTVTGFGVSNHLNEKCISNNPGKRFVYLIGDSHAASISKALRNELEKQNVQLISWTENGCFPIQGTSRLPLVENGLHENYKKELYEFIAKHPAPVIISTRWRLYLEGERFDNEEGGVESGKNSQHYVAKNLDENIFSYVDDEIRILAKRVPVMLIGQIPEAGWEVPDRVAKGLAFNGEESSPMSTSYKLYLEKNSRVDNLMERLSDVTVVTHPDRLVCSSENDRCLNQKGRSVFYRDNNHPSFHYAKMIAEDIVSKYELLVLQ